MGIVYCNCQQYARRDKTLPVIGKTHIPVFAQYANRNPWYYEFYRHFVAVKRCPFVSSFSALKDIRTHTASYDPLNAFGISRNTFEFYNVLVIVFLKNVDASPSNDDPFLQTANSDTGRSYFTAKIKTL